MSLLPYCIIEAKTSVTGPLQGVQDFPVENLVEGELRCFYSSISDSQLEGEVENALRFHQVISQIFSQTAVVPFRFHELVNDETELRNFLRERGKEYARALARLRNLVQMELRISIAAQTNTSAKTSGKEYLQQRRMELAAPAAAAAQAREQLRDLVRDWRERQTAAGLRCYALVPREKSEEWKKRIGELNSPAGLQLMPSGPWPATEFMQPQETAKPVQA